MRPNIAKVSFFKSDSKILLLVSLSSLYFDPEFSHEYRSKIDIPRIKIRLHAC